MKNKQIFLTFLVIIVALTSSVSAYAKESQTSLNAFEVDNGRTVSLGSNKESNDDVAATMRRASGSDQLNTTGYGVRVGIYDLGGAENHPLFAHNLNVSSKASAGRLAHATRLVGIVSAFAPNATLNSHWNREVHPMLPLNPMTDGSSDIAVHSWGDVTCSRMGLYNFESAAFDSYTIPTIFAIGNSGEQCGNEDGYGTVLMAGQSAKNVMTVGSTDANGSISGFSSKGPTLGGQIAPTVVLLGEDVLSTCTAGTYCEASGTSYTAPAVAGIAAQLFEQYRGLFGETDETATIAPSLLRALLVNSATDLGNPGPDYEYGFGQVNAAEASAQLQALRFAEKTVADGEVSDTLTVVPESMGELRVTLAWNDVPAVMENGQVVGSPLVNDLDVMLIAPDGKVYRPFVLNPSEPSQIAVVGVDSLNTIEQIVVRNPMAGEWVISVSASINSESDAVQPFSIAHSVHDLENTNVPLAVSLSNAGATTMTTSVLLLTFAIVVLATLAVTQLRGIKNGSLL